MDLVIAESEHCYVSFPIETSPLCPTDKDPVSHMLLAPKAHYTSCLELEEQV